jgi:hypothetical protein
VSLKSYSVLNSNGFADNPGRGGDAAAGFAEQAWQLFLGECGVDPPFDPGRDLICLVGDQMPAVHRGNWQVISERVSVQDPDTVRDAGLSKCSASTILSA